MAFLVTRGRLRATRMPRASLSERIEGCDRLKHSLRIVGLALRKLRCVPTSVRWVFYLTSLSIIIDEILVLKITLTLRVCGRPEVPCSVRVWRPLTAPGSSACGPGARACPAAVSRPPNSTWTRALACSSETAAPSCRGGLTGQKTLLGTAET